MQWSTFQPAVHSLPNPPSDSSRRTHGIRSSSTHFLSKHTTMTPSSVLASSALLPVRKLPSFYMHLLISNPFEGRAKNLISRPPDASGNIVGRDYDGHPLLATIQNGKRCGTCGDCKPMKPTISIDPKYVTHLDQPTTVKGKRSEGASGTSEDENLEPPRKTPVSC